MDTLVASQHSPAVRTGLVDRAGSDWVDAEVPCRVHDAELWFAETPEGVARAQQFCVECPLRTACLAGAMERQEPWGVWGGELFERGVPVARTRRPGRPRTDDGLHRRRAAQALADRPAGRAELDLDVRPEARGSRDDHGTAA
jgi:WhiB family redox-sensing transcriptional regulator